MLPNVGVRVAPAEIVNVLVRDAELKSALPACETVIEQVPALTAVIVKVEIVQ